MEFARKENGFATPQAKLRRLQFGCLLAALAMIFAFFLLEDRASGVAYLLAERYLTVPAMVFLGASACQELPRRNRWHLYAGAVMVGLFVLNQILHQVLEAEAKQVGTFLCAYALCLPFAAATEDAQRQKGLKWMAGLFVAVGVLLTAYGVLLLLGAVPEYLQNYVYWDGARFYAMGHPNICATLLMIGMTFTVGFAIRSRKLWARAVLGILALGQFAALSLTNGRTTIILTCLLLGGIAFCACRGRGWKRFALAALAAVVVMAAAFGVSRMLFGWNQARLMGQRADALAVPFITAKADDVQPEETKPAEELVAEQYQGTLIDDLKTFNGRDWIWKTAMKGLGDNSRIKYIGTEYVEMILTRYSAGTIFHTHNSWLEALYRMGLPGLGAALVITVLAVWSAAVVLWRNSDLWKSCVALLTMCLLGCAMLEPYLFVVDVSYYYLDFLFLMCLGYLCLWRGEKVA